MKISVSTNPPKQDELLNYLSMLNGLDIDYIHLDIMDGILVENKTFDASFLPQIQQVTSLPIDAHLMVYNPQIEYKNYLHNGVDCISLHYECFANNLTLITVLKDIQKYNIKASLAIQVDTPLEEFLPVVKYCDRVLVMSVKIGKSGQTFDTKTFDKIKTIKEYVDKNNLGTVIEVDGGVTPQIVPELKKIGVSIVVVGGYLFNSQDKKQAIVELKK